MTEELRKRAVNALWEELYVVGMTSEFYTKFIELFAFRLCVEDAMKEIEEAIKAIEPANLTAVEALDLFNRHLSKLTEEEQKS